MTELTTDLQAAGYELRETHISKVFLGHSRVYKVKKPVSLGFLDFSTLARRKAACEAEVALNRRLAPDVYLGVVPVARDDRGRHRIGADGDVVEWAVEMQRLSDEDSAEARLARGALSRTELSAVAARLSAFHRACRCDEETAAFGRVDRIRDNVQENFEQTRRTAGEHVAAKDVREIERYQLDMLDRHADLFEARVQAGRVRDGHGDLRLEHVYFRGGEQQPGDRDGATAKAGLPAVTVIDCIEFNERFRYGDVCADVAFLSMDLAWHDRADLAEWFLAQYARHAGDYGLYPLIDFYQSYRAYVRGKVASFLEEDPDTRPEVRKRAHAQARKYYRLAQAAARPPVRRPVLCVVSGPIASGKSTVSDALSAALACPVVDADRARKQLAGVEPEQPLPEAAFAGHYSEAASERVYATLAERAQAVLVSGRMAIVEATCRSRAHRQALRALAERLSVPFLLVECRVPEAVTRARLVARERGTSISDGRLALWEDLKRAWEPIDELPASSHMVLDTTAPVSENVARIRSALGA